MLRYQQRPVKQSSDSSAGNNAEQCSSDRMGESSLELLEWTEGKKIRSKSCVLKENIIHDVRVFFNLGVSLMLPQHHSEGESYK